MLAAGVARDIAVDDAGQRAIGGLDIRVGARRSESERRVRIVGKHDGPSSTSLRWRPRTALNGTEGHEWPGLDWWVGASQAPEQTQGSGGIPRTRSHRTHHSSEPASGAGEVFRQFLPGAANNRVPMARQQRVEGQAGQNADRCLRLRNVLACTKQE